MRMMLRVGTNPAKGDERAKRGTLAGAIGAFMEKAKPEAAYFTIDAGERAAFF